MYKCFFCQKVVPAKIPCKKVITAKRLKHYGERRADPKNGVIINRPIAYLDEKGKRKLRYPGDPGGTGYEIAQEVQSCPRCAAVRENDQSANEN